MRLEVETGYPAGGDVRVRVLEAPDGPWELSLRVPQWAESGATLDGVPVGGPVAQTSGLQAGDVVRLSLPVEVRVTRADERIDAVRGCVAFERGPLVLCLESADLPDGLEVDDVVLADVTPVERDGRTGVSLRRVDHGDGPWPYVSGGQGVASDDTAPVLVADLVPYHSWANRGPSTMRVWVPAG